MSLSFVKTAVLSSTDGISHNEETSIDTNETQSLRAGGLGSGAYKPLFEQLRANRDAEQERDAKYQRSLRGTRALDEEDCAHLEFIERMREENEYVARSTVEREVALFRAARVDRGLVQTVVVDGGASDDENDLDSSVECAGEGAVPQQKSNTLSEFIGTKKETMTIVPKFTIKKRKKIASSKESDMTANDVAIRSSVKRCGGTANDDAHEYSTDGNDKGSTNDDETRRSEGKRIAVDVAAHDSSSVNNDAIGGILGLGCYGSDSD